MSDKKDKINKKRVEQDWSKVERNPDLIDYVYNKYGDVKVTDNMVDDLYDYVMMKREGEVKEDFARANQAEQAEQAKQMRDDVDLVDVDDVDLFASLDLENRVKTLKEDFTRLLKAKKAKEAKEAEEAVLKVPKEVIEVSSNEDEELFALMMLNILSLMLR
nr:hypothetical protein [Tanacetum cinerariifolium]